MYLFDLFFLNVDRHVNNFGFIINKGHYSLGLLDNEEILLYDNLVPLINATYEKEKWYQELKQIQNNDHNKKEDLEMVIRNNLKTFLNDSSEEYIELFENIYNMLNPMYFVDLLEKIEKENIIYTKDGYIPLIIPRKDELLRRYLRNYNLITDVFNKYKGERRMRCNGRKNIWNKFKRFRKFS